MTQIKIKQEIETMAEGGKISKEMLDKLSAAV